MRKRLKAAVKLGFEMQFTLLCMRVQNLRKLQRPNRHPIASISREMTARIGKVGRTAMNDHPPRAVRPVFGKHVRADHGWIFENFRVRAAEILPNMLDVDRYLALL